MQVVDEVQGWKDKIAALQRQLQDKEQQITALTQQNAVLIRNISSLYVTAKAEIARHSKEASELREQ